MDQELYYLEVHFTTNSPDPPNVNSNSDMELLSTCYCPFCDRKPNRVDIDSLTTKGYAGIPDKGKAFKCKKCGMSYCLSEFLKQKMFPDGADDRRMELEAYEEITKDLKPEKENNILENTSVPPTHKEDDSDMVTEQHNDHAPMPVSRQDYDSNNVVTPFSNGTLDVKSVELFPDLNFVKKESEQSPLSSEEEEMNSVNWTAKLELINEGNEVMMDEVCEKSNETNSYQLVRDQNGPLSGQPGQQMERHDFYYNCKNEPPKASSVICEPSEDSEVPLSKSENEDEWVNNNPATFSSEQQHGGLSDTHVNKESGTKEVTPALHNVSSHRQRDLESITAKFCSADEKEHRLWCAVCQKTFSNDRNFKMHKKIFACHLCGCRSKNANRLCQHMLKRHGRIFFQCKKCCCSFDNKFDLQDHSMIHDLQTLNSTDKVKDREISDASEDGINSMVNEKAEEAYECSYCSFKTFYQCNLQFHLQKWHSGKKYQCKICPVSFCKKSDFREHMLGFHEIYMCHICNFQTTESSEITQHKDGKHVKHDLLECQICGERHLGHVRLNAHLLKMHNVERIFKCGECKRSFHKEEYLTQHHIDLHSVDDRPYQCSQCSKNFKYKRYLAKHFSCMHKLNDLFICEVCGKGFKRKYNVIQHIKSIHRLVS